MHPGAPPLLALLALLLTTSAVTAQKDVCPFDGGHSESPCNAAQCTVHVVPGRTNAANTSEEGESLGDCVTKIEAWCAHPNRTYEKDPGCYDFGNVTASSPTPAPAPAPASTPAPAPAVGSPAPSSVSAKAPSPASAGAPSPSSVISSACSWSGAGRACSGGGDYEAYANVASEADCAQKCEAKGESGCCQWWPDGHDTDAGRAKCTYFANPLTESLNGTKRACTMDLTGPSPASGGVPSPSSAKTVTAATPAPSSSNATGSNSGAGGAPAPAQSGGSPSASNKTGSGTASTPSPSSSASTATGPSSSGSTAADTPSPVSTTPSGSAVNISTPSSAFSATVPATNPSTVPSPSIRASAPSPSSSSGPKQAYVKVQVALSLGADANVTNEELQAPEVKTALTKQLAIAIGIDSSLVTITDIYLCPGGSPKCPSARRALGELGELGDSRHLDAVKQSIVVEFEVKGSEEVVSAAETNLATDSFQETLGAGATTSLSSALNKKIAVTVDSPPVTLERISGAEETADDADKSGDGTADAGTLPDWVIPAAVGGGGLLAVVSIGLAISKRRRENKLAKTIRPSAREDDEEARQEKSSSRQPFQSKGGRGRDSSYNPTSETNRPQKRSPYAVPHKAPSSVASPSGHSPYATQGKVLETAEPRFNPAPTASTVGMKSDESPGAGGEGKTTTGKKNMRPLPPLRTGRSGAKPKPMGLPAIGPGTPVALPSPSAVNRYRAYQADKKAKQERKRKAQEAEALVAEKAAEADGGSSSPSGSPSRRRGSISPAAMSAAEKSQMLEQYKVAHKRMYASVKERLKQEHLSRLQKLAKLRADAERAQQVGSPKHTTISPRGSPVSAAQTRPSDVLVGASKKTVGSLSAAAAGKGAVPSPYSRAEMSRSKIHEASEAEAAATGTGRAEVLKNYKNEHKRMREQMKAKLKAEYMERLRRERAAKKKKAGESRIGGEGKTREKSAGDGIAPAMMGALGLKATK